MPILLNADGDLSSVTHTYPSLTDQRVLTSNLDVEDLYTFEGLRYEVEFDEVLASNEVQYIMYQMPPLSSGYIVGLSSRNWKSLNGAAEMEILWDTSGITLGDSLTIFNSNRNSANTGNMTVNLITGTPTSDGIIREKDFLTGSGTGSNSSGSISPSLGLRLYSPDSFFVFKLTNTHSSSNRIKVTYSWVEIPVEFINL